MRALKFAGFTSAFALSLTSFPAFAQGADKADSETVPGDEIIVTANKRPERLLDVPAAITALNADDLTKLNIRSTEDLRNVVPNLYLEQALGGTTTPKVFLRGLGTDNQVFSFDSPIGIYFDGVYIARTTGALIDTFDVEQVEFLRGPQGTLFGRNNSVGALRINHKNAPLDKVEFAAEFSYGTKNQTDVSAALGVPLIEDKLGVRFTVLSRQRDGFQTDLTTGIDYMTNNILAGRFALRFKPSDAVDLTIRADKMIDHSRPTQASNFRINPDNDLYTFESSPGAPNINEVEPWGISGQLDIDLGNVNLTSITAYRELRYRNANDVDGRADVASFQVDAQNLDESQFSQEIYLVGDTGGAIPISWTLGGFFFREENDLEWALRIFSPPTTQLYHQITDSYATYGELSANITDRLELTGGLRYSYEKKALEAKQNLADGTPNTNFLFEDSISVSRVNWRLAADYALTPRMHLYATAGTGFRSGGFNGSARDIPSITTGGFGPESTFTVEGGLKIALPDFRLNADYFYARYTDLQLAITLSDGTISTTNVNATVHGLEADANFEPTPGLEFYGNLGLTFNNIDNSPLVLKNTAKFQFLAGARYGFDLGGLGRLSFSGDVSHTSGTFNSTDNVPTSFVPAYELVNSRIAFDSAGGWWSLAFSVTNLTDHRYAAHTFDIAGGFISGTIFPSTPRRFLATASFRIP